MIAKTYNYTDEQIGEIPLVRLRQMVANIQQDAFVKFREEQQRAGWLGRTIAVFVAGGYMVDAKSGNPALEAARELGIDDLDVAMVQQSAKQAESKPKEARPGSFEKIMGMFAN